MKYELPDETEYILLAPRRHYFYYQLFPGIQKVSQPSKHGTFRKSAGIVDVWLFNVRTVIFSNPALSEILSTTQPIT